MQDVSANRIRNAFFGFTTTCKTAALPKYAEVVQNDVLMFAHLVIGVDHEALRRMEALQHVTAQKLPYLVLGLTTLLPGMRDFLCFPILVRTCSRPRRN
jgi:hypothetical protein